MHKVFHSREFNKGTIYRGANRLSCLFGLRTPQGMVRTRDKHEPAADTTRRPVEGREHGVTGPRESCGWGRGDTQKSACKEEHNHCKNHGLARGHGGINRSMTPLSS